MSTESSAMWAPVVRTEDRIGNTACYQDEEHNMEDERPNDPIGDVICARSQENQQSDTRTESASRDLLCVK